MEFDYSASVSGANVTEQCFVTKNFVKRVSVYKRNPKALLSLVVIVTMWHFIIL